MTVLKWAVVFLVLSLVAAVLGFGGVAEGLADIAKVLFGLFVVVMLVLAVLGLTVYKSVT